MHAIYACASITARAWPRVAPKPQFALTSAVLPSVTRRRRQRTASFRHTTVVPSPWTPPEDTRPAVAPTRHGRSRVPAAAWASPPSHAARRGGTRCLMSTSSRCLPVFLL